MYKDLPCSDEILYEWETYSICTARACDLTKHCDWMKRVLLFDWSDLSPVALLASLLCFMGRI
jgi:hypothetical protein